jgi:hypothetical protein
MNPVDYSKALQREKEYFRDTINKDREGIEKRAMEREEVHKNAQKKKTEIFIKDKADLQNTYAKNLDKIQEKTQESLHDKNLAYQKKLAQEKEIFQDITEKRSKDFNQRLNHIKTSYQDSFKSEKDTHEQIQSADKSRYDKNIQGLTKSQDEKINSFQSKMTNMGENLKSEFNEERDRLNSSHKDQIREMTKNESSKEADLKDRISEEISKSRGVYQSDVENLRDYSEKSIKDAKSLSEDRANDLALEYAQRTKDLTESQRNNTIKENAENQGKMAELRRHFLSELRYQDLKDQQSHRPDQKALERKKNKEMQAERIAHDSKVRQLKERLADTRTSTEQLRNTENLAYKDSLKVQSAEASLNKEKRLNELNYQKDQVIAKERVNKLQEVEAREGQNRLSTMAYERQLMLERNASEERIKKLKENFNVSLKSLEEKSKNDIESISKSSSQDKVEFIKQVQDQRHNEIYEMKREFNKLMDKTVSDYEKRLADHQKNYEIMKNNLEHKLHTVMDQSLKEVESHRRLFEDRRMADLRSHKIVLDQKDQDHKQSLNALNSSYERKLNQMVADHDTKLKLITNEYDTKLKTLAADHSKLLNEKDLAHQADLQHKKMTYEEEKSRLIDQYENQLQTLKIAHKEKLDNAKEYKRLS